MSRVLNIALSLALGIGAGCQATDAPTAPAADALARFDTLDAGAAEADAQPQDAALADAVWPDAALPDAAPPSTVDPPRTVSPQQQLEVPIEFAALLSRGVFVETADGSGLLTPEGLVPMGSAAGRAHGVAELRRGQPLIAGEAGLFIWDGQTLAPSPLSAAAGPVHHLLAAPGPAGRDLWLHTDDGLALYRDGVLTPLDVGALPTEVLEIAIGPWPDGLAGVWMLTAEALYALVVTDDGLAAWPASRLEGTLEAMAVDGPGAVWVIADGVLHRRALDGRWRVFDALPFTPVALAAAPDAQGLWIAADDDTLWYQRSGRFSQIADAPPFEQLSAGAGGGVLLWGQAGLYTARPGAFLGLTGVSDGASITEPATVRLRPAPAEDIERLSFSLDGAPAEGLAGPPYVWAIDPLEVGDGAHRVVFEATWRGGNTASAALRFSSLAIGPPTWKADIEPMFEVRCGVCHGDGGYSRALFRIEQWRDQVERILTAVTDGRMPLPPAPALTPDEVRLIEGWRDAGFPEEWP